MYGQLVHGLTTANGDPQRIGVGTGMTSACPIHESRAHRRR
jgi:hypothetical protein